MTTQYVLISCQEPTTFTIGIYRTEKEALLAFWDIVKNLKGIETVLADYEKEFQQHFDILSDDGEAEDYLREHIPFSIVTVTMDGPQDIAEAFNYTDWYDWNLCSLRNTQIQLLCNLKPNLCDRHHEAYGLIASKRELEALHIE